MSISTENVSIPCVSCDIFCRKKERKGGLPSKLPASFTADVFLCSQCCILLPLHLPYMDICVSPVVINHTDQIPECMTCVNFLITLPPPRPSLWLESVKR